MIDQRVKNFAKILVHYSVKAKKGEIFSISGTSLAEPLIVEVYEELLRTGVFPEIKMSPPGTNESFFKLGQDHHFKTLPSHTKNYYKSIDGIINISSADNTRALSAIDPKKQALFSKTMNPLRGILMKKKWTSTLFPTLAYAQDAEMSLRDFEDFVFSATFSDEDKPIKAWESIHKMQDRMIKKLKGADEVRIVGPDTDLKMSVKNRIFINSSGTHNMPSGEIFTGPIEDSVEGYISYDFPVCVQGREVDGIRLVFKKGLVVEATAEKNQDFLLAMLDTDKGARRLGELGIGTNMKIQKFIKNILFDEKIGGTIHLALGQAYEESGGKNKSALHWDMIKDLRKGGTLYVDGKIIQKDGVFKI